LAATIGRQIERMIEVRRVFVFTDTELVHREVALFRAELSEHAEQDLLSRFSGAKVLQRETSCLLIEVAGTEAQVSSILDELRGKGLTEFVRSGRVAVTISGDYEADLSRSIHELRPGASEGPDF
jgi:acetolactate synthase-1/3 small subunit